MTSHTIDRFMTTDPCGVDEALTLADAADRMQANNVHHLLVVRGDRLAGVVALADLNLATIVSEHGAGKTPVRTAARPALACSPNTPIAEVAKTMEANHLDSAVVVDSDAHVIGIFTITDALRALRELAVGHPVEPEVTSTFEVRPDVSSPDVPHLRVKRMVRSHHAAPTPNDGTAFGKVFP